MKLIKLTTEAGSSKRGDVQWATGTTVSLPEAERRKTLCKEGLIHVYAGETVEHALALGLMMDPAHARIGDGVRAFEVTGELVARDATKAGGWCFEVGEELEVTLPTREQRVRFAIYCAQAVVSHDACPEWWKWAERWLDGSDRSERSAVWAALAPAPAAWWAAQAAANVAEAVWAAQAVWGAQAAWAAQAAAQAEAETEVSTVRAAPDLDLAELALGAIREETK